METKAGDIIRFEHMGDILVAEIRDIQDGNIMVKVYSSPGVILFYGVAYKGTPFYNNLVNGKLIDGLE